MSGRALGVSVGSLVGSFFVYAAHVACGGGAITHRAITSAPAQTASAPASATVAEPSTPSPKSDACACAGPRTTAFFAASGDEKLTIDPIDAQASLDLAYVRGPLGKKQIVLSGVVRGYRTDVLAERPTTLAIRVTYPEGTTPTGPLTNAAVKDVEAHVSTWGAGAQFAPRVYASVAKSTVTVTVSDSVIELRGSLTLKDPPTGRTLVLDKLSLRKSGTALLPERNAVWKP